MLPLSCVNCCHNPLQLGPTGTAFGYCTRHRVVLQSPELLTCGQLRRKDLYGASADREQAAHAPRFVKSGPALLRAPRSKVGATRLYERPNGGMPADRVVDEVRAYGAKSMPKIATMAALRQIPGARAEVALTSLGRVYVSRSVARGGRWTSGLHLLWWTLGRAAEMPQIDAVDLRATFGQRIEQVTAVARWLVIAHRLTLIAEVARYASEGEDPVGDLRDLPEETATHGGPEEPEAALRFLRSAKVQRRISRALSRRRYEELRETVRVPSRS